MSGESSVGPYSDKESLTKTDGKIHKYSIFKKVCVSLTGHPILDRSVDGTRRDEVTLKNTVSGLTKRATKNLATLLKVALDTVE